MAIPMRRLIAILFLSVALVGTSTIATAPAQAKKWRHQDAIGDVMKSPGYDESGMTDKAEPAPDFTHGDITRVLVKHKHRVLVIHMRVRGPVRGPIMVGSMIKTPRKQLMLMSVRVPGGFMNSTELIDVAKMDDDDGATVRCRGLKRLVSPDRRLITLRVPTRCIGHPRWVRLSVHLSTANPNGDMFDDDGLRTGISVWGVDRMSPRIRRG